MIQCIDPNSDEFKKAKKLTTGHSCLVCEKPLKETGVYFSLLDLNKEGDEVILYRVGCKYCKTLYTMEFKIMAVDFDKFLDFNIAQVICA